MFVILMFNPVLILTHSNNEVVYNSVSKNNDNGPKYGQFYRKTNIRFHSVDFQ